MNHYPETLAAPGLTSDQSPDNARTLAHEGETYRLAGRYPEALAAFDRAIALEPGYAWALAHRGETYRLAGRYSAALADFNRALELRPAHVWTLAHRGAVYRVMRRSEEAVADLSRSLELKPGYAWALIFRADAYMLRGRYEEALTDFDQAIALDQNIMQHWQGERGMLLNALGHYSETITCCERALQEKPKDHIALYSLVVATAHWQGVAPAQAKIDEAQAVLKVVPRSSFYAGAIYRLGGLAALQDQSDQALTYLATAIRLDDEPADMARHDPAWFNLRADPRFQTLIAEFYES
jgi:tetratricopeptide (TPR) repeat protein